MSTGAKADPEVLHRIADASQARKEALEQKHNQNVDSDIASGNSLANDLAPLLSKIILIFLLLIMLVLIANMLLKNGSSRKSVKTLILAQSDELHCWSQHKAHGNRRPL